MDYRRPIRTVAHRSACIALVAGASVLVAAAQPPASPSRSFTPVDPGIVDLSTNALSLRILQIDQRLPTGFDQVYKVSPSAVPSAIGNKPMFARRSGALTAIFPHAVYKNTEKGGVEPVIPPDTRFLIGEIEPAPISPAPSRTAVDRHADFSTRRAASSSARRIYPPVDPAVFAPTISQSVIAGMMTDEAYRVRRIHELLQCATAADASLDR